MTAAAFQEKLPEKQRGFRRPVTTPSNTILQQQVRKMRPHD